MMKQATILLLILAFVLIVLFDLNLYLVKTTPEGDLPDKEVTAQIDQEKIQAEDAYKLYHEALRLKQEKQFAGARDKLTAALGLLEIDTEAYLRTRDELYFHLPVAEVTDLIKQHRMEEAKSRVDEIGAFIGQVEDLSVRYEYAKVVDTLRSSLGYMHVAIEARHMHVQKVFQVALQSQFVEWGNYPEDQGQFEDRLLPYLELEKDYEFLSYGRDGEKAWADFRDREQDVVFTVVSELGSYK